MRIGIDALPLRKQRTGIENYVEGLLQQLPSLAPQHDYFLYSNSALECRWPLHEFTTRIDKGLGCLPGALWLRTRAGKVVQQDHLDIFWATYPVLPAFLPREVAKIVTIYDLVWHRFPETTSRYNLLVQRWLTEKSIRQADQVVVISNTVKQELTEYFDIEPEKISLVYPGIAERYKPVEQTEAARYISRQYGVAERYLATVGIVHPRKNHAFMVQALGVLKRRAQLNCPLLIVGPSGWKNTKLFREIEAAGLTDQDVRFIGYMPDEDLAKLYAGAQAFVFATLYEGFGLPPVEALACGCPVVSSDSPAMPEVLSDAAILKSLHNVEGFADAIQCVLTDDKLRDTLRAKGLKQAGRFRYEHSAEQLLEVFQRAYAGKREK